MSTSDGSDNLEAELPVAEASGSLPPLRLSSVSSERGDSGSGMEVTRSELSISRHIKSGYLYTV